MRTLDSESRSVSEIAYRLSFLSTTVTIRLPDNVLGNIGEPLEYREHNARRLGMDRENTTEWLGDTGNVRGHDVEAGSLSEMQEAYLTDGKASSIMEVVAELNTKCLFVDTFSSVEDFSHYYASS